MQPLWVVTAVMSGLLLGMPRDDDEQSLKFSDCPPAVRQALQAEAKGAKVETVTREKDGDEEAVYWAEATVAGKPYTIGVLEDGTLVEMNLAVGEEVIPLDRSPAAVQATLRSEAFGEKVQAVGRDRKYGVAIYEAVVDHKGKTYEIVVAEDGTLVEKVLIIDEEEVELAACPAAVKAALHDHARGGTIRDVTRSGGIVHPTYEAEVEIKGKVYLIEVDEGGLLLTKSLEAAEE